MDKYIRRMAPREMLTHFCYQESFLLCYFWVFVCLCGILLPQREKLKNQSTVAQQLCVPENKRKCQIFSRGLC